jgi:hypothetical protein
MQTSVKTLNFIQKISVCFFRCCCGPSVPRGEYCLKAMGYSCKRITFPYRKECVVISIKCFVNRMEHCHTANIRDTLELISIVDYYRFS